VAIILLIEDEPLVRQVIAQMLVDAGHEVVEADNGVQGVRLFRVHSPNIVITDIVMPEKEGIEIIREIHEQQTNIPIIAISGIAAYGSVYLRAASALGADAVLAKPFSARELVAKVDEVLSKSLV
jgi:DNA-binding response OmpR family regulator